MREREKTRKLLMMHYQAYPQMKIQDIFKFPYQSVFGCEHMIASSEMLIENIYKEFNSNQYGAKNIIEALDGNYSRVYLGLLNGKLSAETLGKLFCLSSESEQEGIVRLEEKLAAVRELISEGILPLSCEEFTTAAAEWREMGYPAVHHSSEFRNAYCPSYRVISNEYVKFLPLFEALDEALANGTVKLAVEGGSASGKTTFGEVLKKVYDCTVLHTDDFFLRPEQRSPERYAEPGGNLDRERFLAEVLIPLSKNEKIEYRRFDCSTLKIEPPIKINPKKLIVIEGTYSMHPEFQKYYNMSVFLDILPELQRERILRRNSLQMANRFFSEWIPLESVYFSKLNIKEKCTFCIQI